MKNEDKEDNEDKVYYRFSCKEYCNQFL